MASTAVSTNGHAPHSHANGTTTSISSSKPLPSSSSVTASASFDISDEAAIDRFKQFLRIPTITNDGPNTGANQRAISFLSSLATQLGLSFTAHTYSPNQPVLVITVPGESPSLPSILLNSHYDVVPVMRDEWHHDPFGAEELANGDIVARGAQDMKCVCSAYIEAIARIIASQQHHASHRMQRTVHIAFTPDEETGGFHGMAKWIHTPEFAALNVGFALDEGLANPNNTYTVFYGERAVWWTRIVANGPTGHGSRLIANTATEKLMRVINRLLDYRATQVALLAASHPPHDHGHGCAHATVKKYELGDVVTINLTMLKAGVTNDYTNYNINVIPMQAEAGFDIRIPPSMPLDEFEEQLKAWTAEEGVHYTFYQKVAVHSSTSLDPQQNPFWPIFQQVAGSTGKQIDPQVFPAGTDGRYLREIGIPVLGFSPIALQPILLHDHNERLNKRVFIEGVELYTKLIPALANYVPS